MKGKSILEVVAVFILANLLGRFLITDSGLRAQEMALFGWSFSGGILFVLVPAAVIWLFRRRWSDYGVSLANWAENVDTGMTAYLLLLILPWGAGFGLLALTGIPLHSLASALILGCANLAALGALLVILRRRAGRPPQTPAQGRNNLLLLGFLLLTPILAGAFSGKLTLPLVATVVWQFCLSGFGEEFVWRGYIQSRLNQDFGRPWQVFGVQFGPGLILASLLFGLTHALNTYDPASGQYALSWGWAVEATFSGLVFGVLREKTGSILACGIAHGAPDAVGEAFALLFGWTLG
jgi:membrane protease YdiL (CAAX protease family)